MISNKLLASVSFTFSQKQCKNTVECRGQQKTMYLKYYMGKTKSIKHFYILLCIEHKEEDVLLLFNT